MENNKKKIFISYSKFESHITKEITKELEKLDLYGIELIIDIKNLKFMQDINEFEKKIRDTDYVLLIVSDNFLKSYHCMYEMVMLREDKDYLKKLMVLCDTSVEMNSIDLKNKYLDYWENKFNEMKKSKIISTENLEKDLEVYEKIKSTIVPFLKDIENYKLSNYQDNISLSNIDEIKMFLDISEEMYYMLNVPRTITNNNESKSLVWWGEEGGYTDNLKKARKFTKMEVEKQLHNDYEMKKYAAIQFDVVANFKMNVIPCSPDNLWNILKNKDKIKGNTNLYLDESEIRMHI